MLMIKLEVVGLGTDGASNMASDLNGLNGLWKDVNPFTTHVHCVCHRLALAVKRAGAGMVLVECIQGILREVYTLVQNRPNVQAR